MTTEHIGLTLKRAKLSRQIVTVKTDDGEQLQGMIEALSEWTVTLRLTDGIMYVPIVEIVDVQILSREL